MTYKIDELTNTITKADEYFKRIGLPVAIDSSTALALLRQGELYEDHCVDFHCTHDNYIKVKDKIEGSPQFESKHIQGQDTSHIYLKMLYPHDVELSIGFVSDHMITYYPTSDVQCTLPHTGNYKTILYKGVELLVPDNIEEHLAIFYGDTWKTDPQNKSWNWRNSNAYKKI